MSINFAIELMMIRLKLEKNCIEKKEERIVLKEEERNTCVSTKSSFVVMLEFPEQIN